MAPYKSGLCICFSRINNENNSHWECSPFLTNILSLFFWNGKIFPNIYLTVNSWTTWPLNSLLHLVLQNATESKKTKILQYLWLKHKRCIFEGFDSLQNKTEKRVGGVLPSSHLILTPATADSLFSWLKWDSSLFLFVISHAVVLCCHPKRLGTDFPRWQLALTVHCPSEDSAFTHTASLHTDCFEHFVDKDSVPCVSVTLK